MKGLKRSARTNEKSHTPPPAVLLVLVVLLLVGLAQTTSGKSILRSIGVYDPSQSFTELYFPQPQKIASLTARLDKAPAAVQMAFVIANREHRTIRYHWVIVANGSSRASGYATLQPTVSTRISRTVPTGCVPSRPRAGTSAAPHPSPADHPAATTRPVAAYAIPKAPPAAAHDDPKGHHGASSVVPKRHHAVCFPEFDCEHMDFPSWEQRDRRVLAPNARSPKHHEPKQAKLSVMLTSPAESIDVLIPCNA